MVGAETMEDGVEGVVEAVGVVKAAPIHDVNVTDSVLVSVGVVRTGTVRTVLDVVSLVPSLSRDVYSNSL